MSCWGKCIARAGWLFASLACAAAALAHAEPVLDFSGPQVTSGPHALDGTWDFAAGRLVGPADPWPADSVQVAVPHQWSGGAGPRHGAGTYRVTVRCENSQPLGLALPFQHSAAHVYVNGKLVAEQGRPGPTREQAEASVRQQILALPSAPCPMQVLVQVSNWDMYRGGFVRSVLLGTPQQLLQRHEEIVQRAQLAQGALLFAGLFGLMFFVWRPRDRGPLFFSIFALSWAVSLSLGGERAHGSIAEWFGFDAFLRLLYVSWFFALGTFPWVLDRLYPRESWRRFVWAVTAVALVGGVVTAATPAHLLAYSTPALTAGSVAVALYVGLVLVRALARRRDGAVILLAALVVFAFSVLNDLVLFQSLVSTSLMPYGMMAFVLAPAVLLAQRFSRALTIEEQRAVELGGRADLLVRATQAGVLDWNATTGLAEHSDRYLEMLGLPAGPGAPPPPPFLSLVHPDDVQRIQASFMAQLRDRRVRSGLRRGEAADYRMVRRDGQVIWVHAEAIGVCGADGRTLRYICTFIDITHLKAIEAQLATERERLRLLVQSTKAGFGDWDAVRDEVSYSGRFKEMLGYPADYDTKQWPSIFDMMHPDDRERAREEFRSMIRRKAYRGQREPGKPMSYRLRRTDGSYVWIHAEGISQVDEEGRTVRFITSYLDVTSFREQEEKLRHSLDQIEVQARQLEQQNETLKENVRLREEVERIGRHDIKTPLNSIVAVPRLLREERRLGPEADELLGIVERAGYRILSMVNLSLDLYKMEQGSYVFRPDAVDLNDLAGKVIADLRTHAESKHVLVRQLDGRIPYAWAEELLCYSLLANLLKNAVEASPEGGEVRLRAQVWQGTIQVRISNQGAVPAAIRANFFEKYASLGKASGTGLGTYSARLMARVQDGDVTMETSEQAGTAITVTLRAAPEGAMPPMARHVAQRRGVNAQVLASLPPTRVLLVDDDEYNLLIVRRFLPEPPFTVETAINGRVAVASANARWPDLVFMDLDMPVMGGLQAVGKLRALQAARGGTPCRIVALSSHDDEATRQAALAAGFDRYLSKPVTREMIQETLVALRGAEAPEPIRTQPAALESGAGDAVVIDDDLRPLLAQFIASRRELAASVAAAARAGDREEVRRLAHQLAGSFAMYGFAWAAQQARWIEHHHAQADAGRIEAVAGELLAHLRGAVLRTPTGAIIDAQAARGSSP